MDSISEVNQRASSAFTAYAKLNERTQEDIDHIVKLARPDSEKSYVWTIAFEAAPEVVAAICFDNHLSECREALARVREFPEGPMFSVTALTAYACNSNWKETCFSLGCLERSEDVRNMWLSEFKEFPAFETNLIKHETKLAEKRRQCFEHDGKVTPEFGLLNYVVSVPVKVLRDDSEFHNPLPDSAVAYLLNTPLNLYPFLSSKLCGENIEYFNNKLKFTFQTKEHLDADELNCMCGELKGQLTDGWGEHITNKSFLNGNSVYRILFDTSIVNIKPDTVTVNDNLSI